MRRKGQPRGKTKREKAGYPKREKHNVPDEYDEKLRQEELDRLAKKLDENGRPTPLTEKQKVAIAVSAYRKKWMSCDAKLHFLLKKQLWDTDPNTRTTKLWQCNHCEALFKQEEINVDHIVSEVSCTTFEEFEIWSNNILNAGGDDDLQILCIPCHEIKNVMDANGTKDWKLGTAIKKAIAIQKKKGYDVVWLEENGVVPGKNAKLRRQQIVDKLMEE